MSQEWMIDVLKDLRIFAQANGLIGLAEQLDDTIIVAASELKHFAREEASAAGYADQDSCVPGTLAAGDNI